MDSMEVNKGVAAILVAGIAFFVTGMIANGLVKTHKPHEPAIKVEVAAAAPAGGAAAPAGPAPIGPLLASADAASGATLAKRQCGSCHTFDEGGKNGLGPNLYGVMGRARGGAEGFNYSAALKGKAGNWTYDDMSAWLHKPSAFISGSRMAFAGINSDKQRADVIAYLRSLSKNPLPLP